MIKWLVMATLLFLTLPNVANPFQVSGKKAPVGDFLGWYRLTDGSDVPIWIHVKEEAGKPVVQLSLPAQGAYGLAVENASMQADRLLFSRKNSRGETTSYTFVAKDDMLVGQSMRDGKKLGDLRCRLAAFKPNRGDGFGDVVGCYQSDEGALLRISAWGWKELRCLDLSNGAERTLFLNEKGELCAGSALYAVSRIEARYRIVRDAGGAVTELVRADSTGERHYRRLVFKERELITNQNGTQLAGTLLIPASKGPHPVAVLLGGSDVQTRADVRWEAEILCSLGLATFTYDLSGRGKSTGKLVQSFDESAQNISVLVDTLAKQPEIDPGRIGLCGTSRGGWLGPLTAARNKRVAFLILLSAPAVSPKEQLTSCRLNFMHKAGHKKADLAEAKSYLDLTWQCHLSDAAWERYSGKRKDIERKGWLPILQGPPTRESEDFEWQRLNLNYDPQPALKQVRCAVLCLFGSADIIVEPTINAPIMASCFAAAGNKDWTLRIVPNASHGLTRVDPAAPNSDRPIEEEEGFAPEVWETVRQWLKGRSSAKREPNQ